jgi:hypothetical protein
MKNTTKPEPTWRDVKAKLEGYDRAGLLKLLKDLYELNGANHAFLNARLSLGAAPLTPYKNTISRWIAPDVTKGQDISVVRAKRAISDYKKAVGHPRGVAELSVFYCEEAVGLLSWCGMDDESYHAALVRMFDQALTAICGLPETQRAPFLERLNPLRSKAGQFAWGVKDAFDESWFTAVE